MAVPQESLEHRMNSLAQEVWTLRQDLNSLARLVQQQEIRSDAPEAPAALVLDGATSDAAENWNGAEVFLAAGKICFILVVSLSLRTLVDNGLINPVAGAALGVVYSALVIAYGYLRALRQRPWALLYIICGALLVFSIVLEGHSRLELFGTTVACAIVAGTLLLMGGLSRWTGAYDGLTVAIPCAVLVAFALDFPSPWFLWLAAILALAAVLATVVREQPHCRWMAGFAVGAWIFFWFFWAAKARATLSQGDDILDSLALPGFLPALAVTALVYYLWALWSGSHLRNGRAGFLECCIPFFAGAGAYVCAAAIWAPWGGNLYLLGWAGIAGAAAHFAAAWWIAHTAPQQPRLVASFTASSVVLFVIASPAVAHNPLLLLLLWTTAALVLSLVADAWLHRWVHHVASVLLLYACIAGLMSGTFAMDYPAPIPQAGALGLFGILSAAQFIWMRRMLPKMDDRSSMWERAASYIGTISLVAAVIFTLGAARVALYLVLSALGMVEGGAFHCGQSVLINLTGLALIALGLRRKQTELLTVGSAVALLGVGKVFLYDFMNVGGLSLVLDVFVAGLVLISGSWLWNRWQHTEAGTPVTN